jgi:hypothetical protein
MHIYKWTRGATKGKKFSEEHKQKIGAANKTRYTGKTWEEMYEVEGARLRREAHKLRAQQRKAEV